MTRSIRFSTPACGQCPQQAEILTEIAADSPDVECEKIDATEAPDQANQYGVRSVPSTIVLDKDGTVVSKFDGLTQADEIASVL